MLCKEITGEIIGCAMNVHRTLGPGFQQHIISKSIGNRIK